MTVAVLPDLDSLDKETLKVLLVDRQERLVAVNSELTSTQSAPIASEAAKRRLAPPVSRETIRLLLQNHDLKPWREKNVVRGGTE
ncbi:MAG: hypothetical protein ABSF23_04920 [Terracidiphilus sp.]|jgi:hypothetical protein